MFPIRARLARRVTIQVRNGICQEIVLWEYSSRGPDGSRIGVCRRVPWSRQLDAVKDAALVRSDSRPEFVLAGWTPRLEVGNK